MQNNRSNSTDPVTDSKPELLTKNYYLVIFLLLLILSVNTIVLFENASQFNINSTQTFQKRTMTK